MDDEKFVFFEDIREKKAIARSCKYKNTHGGRVKFNSDYMTRKELQAMNGEIKTYNLNEPMTFYEFNTMPDDLKIKYITSLRERFAVAIVKVAEMMNTKQRTLNYEIQRLGIALGRGKRAGHFRENEWNAFVNREITIPEDNNVESPVVELQMESHTEIVSCSGNVTFIGSVKETFDAVMKMLGESTKLKINIAWEQCDNGRA